MIISLFHDPLLFQVNGVAIFEYISIQALKHQVSDEEGSQSIAAFLRCTNITSGFSPKYLHFLSNAFCGPMNLKHLL